jgi:hypothetical protein
MTRPACYTTTGPPLAGVESIIAAARSGTPRAIAVIGGRLDQSSYPQAVTGTWAPLYPYAVSADHWQGSRHA